MMTAKISACIAELPATPGTGEDRARIASNAVVVLDGASGTDLGVSVSEYVDSLGDHLITVLDSYPSTSLTSAVTVAIEHTTTACGLTPGHAPSSTVSIVRRGAETVDVLVLGDSPVYVSHLGRVNRVTDDRLKRLDPDLRKLSSGKPLTSYIAQAELCKSRLNSVSYLLTGQFNM